MSENDLILKEEPEWDVAETGVSEAAELAGLYKDHQVMDEIVLGPVVLQPPDVACVVSAWSSGIAVSGLTTHAEETHDDSFGARAEGAAYTCDTCGERLPGKSAWIEHIQSSHRPETPYSCRVCLKAYSSKILFIKHQQTHISVIKFAGDISSKESKSKFNVIKHELDNTEDKLHACDICKYRFKQKSKLKQHMSIHTGEKPYLCNMCNKQFRLKSSLKRHIISIHTEHKPYMCETCYKYFNQKGDLNKHMKIHTGQKPFTCEICNKQFTERGSLNRHIRMYTEPSQMLNM